MHAGAMPRSGQLAWRTTGKHKRGEPLNVHCCSFVVTGLSRHRHSQQSPLVRTLSSPTGVGMAILIRLLSAPGRMVRAMKKIIGIACVVLVFAGLGFGIWWRLSQQGEQQQRRGGSDRAAPVAVAPVEVGSIERRRQFTGSLEATAGFRVAPKVPGRIAQLHVDISDVVKRGQLIAELDSDEYTQAHKQAQADLRVAQANLKAAESALEIASREMQRIDQLKQRGVASDSQFDEARAAYLQAQANVAVTEARYERSQAELEAASIRLGYTKIHADWSGLDDHRTVSRRFVDAGDNVSANDPIVTIIEYDPIKAVITVTERDYARLRVGQLVALTTGAYPGETFRGAVKRISPVFESASRQATVELAIDNPDGRLKPGMFVRADAMLEKLDGVTIVPERALVRRAGSEAVFVVDDDAMTVALVPVRVDVRQGGRASVQSLTDTPVAGQVVTLGQQLIDDGSSITIPDPEDLFNGGQGHAPAPQADNGRAD